MRTLAGIALMLLVTPHGWLGMLALAVLLHACAVLIRSMGC